MQETSAIILFFGMALIAFHDLRILYGIALAWRWSYLLYFIFGWAVFNMIWRFWWKAPVSRNNLLF